MKNDRKGYEEHDAESLKPLFEGPNGHKYLVGDIQHALAALASGHVDVDKPLAEQFEALIEYGTSAMRLVGVDYRKRPRGDVKRDGIPWPERIKLRPMCDECDGGGRKLIVSKVNERDDVCRVCQGEGKLPYNPHPEILLRAGIIYLRSLSFVGMKAAETFAMHAHSMAPGEDEAEPEEGKSVAVPEGELRGIKMLSAMGMGAAASLAASLGHLANISCHATAPDADILHTMRIEIVRVLSEVAKMAPTAGPTVH